MSKKINIDYKILVDKIHGELTKSQQMIFNQWINQSSRHQRYFENLSRYVEKGSYFDISPVNVEEDWKKLKLDAAFKVVQKPRKRVYFKKLVAAVTIISFLVGGSLFYSEKFSSTPEIAEEHIEIELKPGKSQATLTLDNGKSYELNQDAGLEIDSKGIKIKSKGSSITYQKVTGDLGADQKKDLLKNKLAYNVLEVPRGGEFYIELSDGTKVWINADSRLKYPVNFSDFDRIVEFIGEAYFEVAPNPSKPFIVKSGMQEIEVLGTAFNLSSYDDDSQIVTTLVEGNVSVKRAYGETKSIYLRPNQQSIFIKKTGKIISKKVDPYQYIAWKSGEFYFKYASMVDIMKVMERWYDIDVFFDSRKGTQLKFSGGFERFANFDKVQNIIEKSSDKKLSFENKNKTIIIKYNI